MRDITGSDQQEKAEVAEIAQPAQPATPVETSAPPVRRKPATPRSQSERLLGVKDPELELTERPVGRKRSSRPAPKPAPRTVTFLIDGEWDAEHHPVGYALAAELAGGESE